MGRSNNLSSIVSSTAREPLLPSLSQFPMPPVPPTEPDPELSPSISSPVTSPSAIINLSREYARAIQTKSYNEMWAKIHSSVDGDGEAGPTIAHVLHPDKASVEEILRAAPDTHMTRLVSSYLESSENTSRLCLSLQQSIEKALSLYSPIGDLLDLIPSNSHLTSALCNMAFDTFVQFNGIENPFPSPSSPSTSSRNENNQFEQMKYSFSELKQYLDQRLLEARRKRRLLQQTSRGSGICLIGCTTGITIVGLVLATHAMSVLLAGSAFVLGGCSLFYVPTQKDEMDRLDAAAKNTYVLNNDLDTIERLVVRLHGTIESDKKLVELGLEEGKGQRHPIEHVVQHLRSNYRSLLQQLNDLDEHICIYFASVNRARSLLLQHIYEPHSSMFS